MDVKLIGVVSMYIKQKMLNAIIKNESHLTTTRILATKVNESVPQKLKS